MGTFANFSAYVASEAPDPPSDIGRQSKKREEITGESRMRTKIWSSERKRKIGKEHLETENGRIRKRATETIGRVRNGTRNFLSVD